jgi:pyridoxamine 5'-phosphate oxidase
MPLDESKVPADPLRLFRRWYAEAEQAGVPQPDAMTLATAGRGCEPSARMVLFKGVAAESFLFYSNYQSLKGRDLAANRKAALVFYWSATRHQVRLSGTVRRVRRSQSEAYFHSRPRGAQLSALASRQSRTVASRAVLERAVVELERRFPGDVPLPDDWGGYALRPKWIEFWESRSDRLHDRLRYVRLQEGGWRRERLSP